MACSLAHLIAMKRFVRENFDLILEDNVRVPVESCAMLVTKAKEASELLKSVKGVECHFRFLGWLSSLTNLEYLLHTHAKNRAYPSRTEKDPTKPEQSIGVFPFPLFSHLESDLEELGLTTQSGAGEVDGGEEEDEVHDEKSNDKTHSRPGGNFMYVLLNITCSNRCFVISNSKIQCIQLGSLCLLDLRNCISTTHGNAPQRCRCHVMER